MNSVLYLPSLAIGRQQLAEIERGGGRVESRRR